MRPLIHLFLSPAGQAYFIGNAGSLVSRTASTATVLPPVYYPRSPASSPSSPGTPSRDTLDCTFPGNPRLSSINTFSPNGGVITAVDPYFSTSSDREAWVSSHGSCPKPPEWQADTLVSPRSTLPSIRTPIQVVPRVALPILPVEQPSAPVVVETAAPTGMSPVGVGILVAAVATAGAVALYARPKKRRRSSSRRR